MGDLSRRQMLIKGAALTATAWSAPAIVTVGASAIAGSVAPQCPAPGVCGDNRDFPCAGANCFCLATAENTCACVAVAICPGFPGGTQACTATSDCPQGSACVSASAACQDPFICQTVCPGPASALVVGVNSPSNPPSPPR
jgi:hypothetical protein